MIGRCAVPFERSYWVVPGKLLAGCYPGDADPEREYMKLNGLVKAGVRFVFNLMEEDEVNHLGQSFKPYGPALADRARDMGIEIVSKRIPIRDCCVPTRETMIDILDLIDRQLNDGRPVYLHCWGGRGRTGTVVGCYLARHGEKDPLAAIRVLRKNDQTAINPSPETSEQCEMVRLWLVGKYKN